jgi:hypothetical protein
MNTQPRPIPFAELPLWRLMVFLHDAERDFGPEAETTRIFARMVRERLGEDPDDWRGRRRKKGVTHGA